MKKFLYLAMALCMGFALTSCDDDEEGSEYAIVDFEGEYWADFIDSKQYGGELIYSADEYKWKDKKTTLSGECVKDDWGDWGWGWKNGVAISNYIDADVENHADYLHQLSVPASNGSNNFGIIWDNGTTIKFADGKARQIKGMQIANTTYALGKILPSLGLAFRFAVIITGLNGDAETGSLEVVLAENESAQEGWSTLELTSLGAVTGLRFDFDLSDSQTPKYLAIDNIMVKTK